MTCCPSIPKPQKIGTLIVLLCISGVLITTALASALSFNLKCSVRVDLVILQHNILSSLWLLVSVIYMLASTIMQRKRSFEVLIEQIRHVATKPAVAIGIILLLLALIMLGLMIALALKRPDVKCYDDSGKFSIVWYFIDSGFFAFLTFAMTYAFIESRIDEREAREVLRNSEILRIKLVRLHRTIEGWTSFCNEFAPFFMNLQDHQKESLLPVLLLYVIDELTWELRELPKVLQESKCSICEEVFQSRQNIVTCVHKPDLVHRDCLMRHIAAGKLKENKFLGKEIYRSSHTLLKIVQNVFEVAQKAKNSSANFQNECEKLGIKEQPLRLLGKNVEACFDFLELGT